MGITIKEIARIANVHRSTVDKVIHKRPGVSDAVRKRIQTILEETGYSPNIVGQALQKQKETIRIAALLLKTDALEIIKAGIESSLKENKNFDVQLTYHITEFSHSKEQVEMIEQQIINQVAGIIITPIDTDEVCEAMNRASDAGIKVVATNFDAQQGKHLCFVGQNFIRAGAIAASIMGLLLGGEGNVVLITILNHRAGSDHFEGRRTGFVTQLEKEFPRVKIIESVAGYDDPKIIERETRELFAKYSMINGIFITGGGVEIIGKLLKEYELAKQTKVICFERYKGILELMKEGVVNCTIDSDLYNQGKLPLDILLQAIVYNKKPEKRYIFLKGEILFKGSIEASYK